jgi:hypothetical protein
MGLAWEAYGLGHSRKEDPWLLLSVSELRQRDNEMKTNRWFAKYEIGSD